MVWNSRSSHKHPPSTVLFLRSLACKPFLAILRVLYIISQTLSYYWKETRNKARTIPPMLASR